jgi:hypothetical protein
MENIKPSTLKKGMRIATFLLIWAVTGWLLYPLIALDKVDLRSAMEYFYRSATGIVIMIILFGKTIFDLLFPIDLSRKKSILYVAFLTLYSLLLAAGIIFMAARILLIFLNKNSDTFTGNSSVQF